MNTLINIEALGWTLVHSVWQGVGLWLLLALGLQLGRRLSPRVRYLGIGAALFGLPVLSAVTFNAQRSLLMTADHGGPSAEPAALLGSPGLLGVFVAVWATGFLLVLMRTAAGMVWIELVLRRRVERVSAAQQEVVERLRRSLRVRQEVRLVSSTLAKVPMTVGWLRPLLIFPTSLLIGLPAQQIELLLAHELVHVRRRDYLVNLVQSVVEALYFFHPAVWWMSRSFRAEREYCCDQAAAELRGAPEYARALMAVEHLRSPVPATAVGATGASLVERIRRLVGPPPKGPTSRLLAVLLPLSILLGGVVVGSSLHSVDPSETQVERDEVQDDAMDSDGGAAYREVGSITWLPPGVRSWWPQIQEAALRHGVSPELLAIHVLVESYGDPDARSSMGAVGLMQVMPSTGAGIAEERGIEGHSTERLLDPEYNLDLGAWYLARQLQHFDQGDVDASVEMAAAAYNGGPTRVRAWIANRKELLEETQRYKVRVRDLWQERTAAASNALDGWRERILAGVSKRGARPVQGAAVSRPYGLVDDRFGTEHDGIDLLAPQGTPVRAALSGTVVEATKSWRNEAAGTVVVLQHGAGLETRYFHLDSFTVVPGTSVEKAQVIGTVGNTGTSTGPHLHFELLQDGTPVDPTNIAVGD